jgi:hypothetical protein
MAQGFCHTFQTTQGLDGREHVGGIGALPPPRFEPPPLFGIAQERFEQQRLPVPLQQPSPELAAHRKVKSQVFKL